jgi:hypothetical protein
VSKIFSPGDDDGLRLTFQSFVACVTCVPLPLAGLGDVLDRWSHQLLVIRQPPRTRGINSSRRLRQLLRSPARLRRHLGSRRSRWPVLNWIGNRPYVLCGSGRRGRIWINVAVNKFEQSRSHRFVKEARSETGCPRQQQRQQSRFKLQWCASPLWHGHRSVCQDFQRIGFFGCVQPDVHRIAARKRRACLERRGGLDDEALVTGLRWVGSLRLRIRRRSTAGALALVEFY